MPPPSLPGAVPKLFKTLMLLPGVHARGTPGMHTGPLAARTSQVHRNRTRTIV